jgi:hypothetical protein
LLIREFGIIIEGVPIICINYHKTGEREVDFACKGAVISSIMKFAENVIEPVESFESNKYHILFKRDKIRTKSNKKAQMIIYTVLDKKEDFSKKLKKKIIGKMDNILNEFMSQYSGYDYSETSQFAGFVNVIDHHIVSSTKTLDDKVSSIFLD